MPGAYQVLLADEDDATALALGAYLQSHGVGVARALSGHEALARLQSGDVVHAVVADAVLPGMGGVELARRLKADARTAGVAVVLQSGRISSAAEEAEAQRAFRVDAVFRKPLDPRELLGRLDALVMLRTGMLRPGALSVAPRNPTTPRQPPMRAGVPLLQGECSLPSLAAVLVHAFEQRLSAVLEVTDPQGTRMLGLHDGLLVDGHGTRLGDSLGAMMVADGTCTEAAMHAVGRVLQREGGRVGELAVRVAGLPPHRVAEALERHPGWLMQRVLGDGVGHFVLRPWRDVPLVWTVVRQDPLRALAEACHLLPSEEAAASLLAPALARHIYRADGFDERVLAVRSVWPDTRVEELVQGNDNLQQAVAHARVLSHQGVRQLLALVLVEALRIAPQVAPRGGPRAGVVAPPPRPWCPPGTPAAEVVLRDLVATEIIRTVGRPAPGLLGVDWDAPAEAVTAAQEALKTRLGPPALDDAELGPARMALELWRARRDEAARILRAPGDLAAHRALHSAVPPRDPR